MKKVKHSSRYKRYQRQRQQSEERKRKRHSLWKREKRRRQLGQPKGYTQPQVSRADYTHVVAPSKLSMISNRDETLQFFSELDAVHKAKKSVWVNMFETKLIAQDGLVVLLAMLIKFRTDRLAFNGTVPRSRSARRVLDESQFLRLLYDMSFKAQVSYDMGLHTHANRQIDQMHTDRLIRAASVKIWGEERRCQGVQRILIELMHNTLAHASRRQGEKHWWLSTEHLRRRVSFSFVDLGVGVFSSLEQKPPEDKFYQWREDVLKVYSWNEQHLVLRLMLQGKMHETVTGNYFRGKGLPSISDVLRRNQVSRVIMITNNTFADLEADRFEFVDVPFSGTFVYWELEKDNWSSPA